MAGPKGSPGRPRTTLNFGPKFFRSSKQPNNSFSPTPRSLPRLVSSSPTQTQPYRPAALALALAAPSARAPSAAATSSATRLPPASWAPGRARGRAAAGSAMPAAPWGLGDRTPPASRRRENCRRACAPPAVLSPDRPRLRAAAWLRLLHAVASS